MAHSPMHTFGDRSSRACQVYGVDTRSRQLRPHVMWHVGLILPLAGVARPRRRTNSDPAPQPAHPIHPRFPKACIRCGNLSPATSGGGGVSRAPRCQCGALTHAFGYHIYALRQGASIGGTTRPLARKPRQSTPNDVFDDALGEHVDLKSDSPATLPRYRARAVSWPHKFARRAG